MGRFGHTLVSLVVGPLRRVVRAVRLVRGVSSQASKSLWGQRLHWPVAALAAGVLAAVVVGPVMSTTTPLANQPHKTLSAGDWPGLVHKKDTDPALATTPGTMVPACADGPAADQEAGFVRKGAGDGRIVLTALAVGASSVSSVSPSSGPLTGDTPVVISGSGFTGAIAVTFGALPALGFSVVADDEITATSPPGVGTVEVSVLTLGGLSVAGSGDQFTYSTPIPSLPSLPSLPPLPSIPGLPITGGLGGGTGSTGSTGSTGGSTGSGSGGSSGSTSTTPGTTPPTSGVPNPAVTQPTGSALPSYGFGTDGQLGCSLIDNQTGMPVGGESAAQQRSVQLALSFIGTPYVWGGESTKGFDCSGLVQFVYSAAGIQLPRTAQEQYDAGPAVAPGQPVVPGDLVFFGGGPTDVSHVGIFVGNGVMVDAPHTGADVRLDKVNGFEPIVGVTDPGN
ncbi:MAG: C40 family peptidase [Acidimicrobiales bacterium]